MKKNYPLLFAVLPLLFYSLPIVAQTSDEVRVAIESADSKFIDPSFVLVKVSSATLANKYTVAYSTQSDFKKSVTTISGAPRQTEFILRGLDYNETYFVKAKSDLNVNYGPEFKFVTGDRISNQKLVGITTKGGLTNQGTFFTYDIDQELFAKHFDYSNSYDYVMLWGSPTRTPYGFVAASIADATGEGEIVSFSLDGTSRILDPYAPHNGSVMLGSDNYLYVVDDWMNFFRGGIYRLHSNGDSVKALSRIIFRFNSDRHGLNPIAPLLELKDGYLYGIAPEKGTGNVGTVFKVKMDGSRFEVIHSFEGRDGANPSNSLIVGGDGYLYGCTENGGENNYGVIYKLSSDGSEYSVLLSFNGLNGKHPKGELLWYNSGIYGTASKGGATDNGVIFSISPFGKNFRLLHDFRGPDGAVPLGGLSLNKNVFYGMTSSGGSNGIGVLYQMVTNGSEFRPLFNFSQDSGGVPNGKLLVIDENNFEGKKLETMNDEAGGGVQIDVAPKPFTDSVWQCEN